MDKRITDIQYKNMQGKIAPPLILFRSGIQDSCLCPHCHTTPEELIHNFWMDFYRAACGQPPPATWHLSPVAGAICRLPQVYYHRLSWQPPPFFLQKIFALLTFSLFGLLAMGPFGTMLVPLPRCSTPINLRALLGIVTVWPPLPVRRKPCSSNPDTQHCSPGLGHSPFSHWRPIIPPPPSPPPPPNSTFTIYQPMLHLNVIFVSSSVCMYYQPYSVSAVLHYFMHHILRHYLWSWNEGFSSRINVSR